MLGDALFRSPVCRSVYDGTFNQAGEHASEFIVRQHPAHGHSCSAGLLSTAPAALLPPQHQHGLPAQCEVTDSGTLIQNQIILTLSLAPFFSSPLNFFEEEIPS